ncbi:hypothetical protein KIW84_073628 [Lathyrus oleraceus]|uniref:F-box/LRR-repeat protein 15/At3g58940/PEG3-like LRR domain-containing protein n=1 Tax=Pisum sativum TaxID=3888 RepID=A0A9D4ZXM4_PEA|nr:hypothetical protein KIW84_073628 [Pisum sativum]
MPTKNAVATSILSKRWKYLWMDLFAFNFAIYRNQSDSGICNPTNHLLDLVHRLLHRSNSRPISLTIAMYGSGITVDPVKLHCFLSDPNMYKVEELDISLNLKSNPFILPQSFSTCASFNNLYLQLECVLNVPSCICFSNLKMLNISSVTFSNDNSLQKLLSGCVVLQELIMFGCGWNNIKQVNIAMSTLRKLSMDFNYPTDDELFGSKIEIDAVNLLSFTCSGFLTVEVSLVNLASIVDAYIDLQIYFPLNQPYIAAHEIKLLTGLHHVKSLRLSNDTLQCLFIAQDNFHVLPSFYDLKRLDVNFGTVTGYTNAFLMDFLKKTPKLEELEIPNADLKKQTDIYDRLESMGLQNWIIKILVDLLMVKNGDFV